MCTHLEPAYADQPPRMPLPESEQARDRCILLPLFPQMTATMQMQIVEELRRVLDVGYRARSEQARVA
jgi:dTDP-4-amino-4,6-dideoxygalactose transaminase